MADKDKTRLQSTQSTIAKLEEKMASIESIVSKIKIIEASHYKLKKGMNEINNSLLCIKDQVIVNLLNENKRLNDKVENLENNNKVLFDRMKSLEKNNAKCGILIYRLYSSGCYSKQKNLTKLYHDLCDIHVHSCSPKIATRFHFNLNPNPKPKR